MTYADVVNSRGPVVYDNGSSVVSGTSTDSNVTNWSYTKAPVSDNSSSRSVPYSNGHISYDLAGKTLQQFTWSFWFQVKSSGSTGDAIGGMDNDSFSIQVTRNGVYGYMNARLTDKTAGTAAVTLVPTNESVGRNTWAHVVIRYNAGLIDMFLNNSLIGSKVVTPLTAPSGSSTMTIGALSGYTFAGYADEIVFYDTAVSDEMVKSLYDGSTPPAVNQDAAYIATAALGSALSVDPTVTPGYGPTVTVEPATTNVEFVDPRVVAATAAQVLAQPYEATADMPGGETSGALGVVNVGTDYVKTPDHFGKIIKDDSRAGVAILSGEYNYYFDELDFSNRVPAEAAVTGYNLVLRVPSISGTLTVIYGGNTIATITTTGIFVVSLPDYGVGKRLQIHTASTSTEFYNLQSVAPPSDTRPLTDSYIQAKVGVVGPANVTGPAATGSAAMAAPALDLGYGPTVAAEPAAGTAVMADAAAAGDKAAMVPAQPLEADASMPGGYFADATVSAPALEAFAYAPDGGFAVPVAVAADAAVADVVAIDPAVSAFTNTVIEAGAAKATAYIAPPLEVDESADDRYFQYIIQTLREDLSGAAAYAWWARLDQHSGNAVPIMDNEGNLVSDQTGYGQAGALSGDYNWNVFGPESRRALHMQNGSMVMAAPGRPSDPTSYWRPDSWSFEAVIRTTDSNGTIFHGNQTWGQTGGFNDDITFGIVDGKLNWTANTSLLVIGNYRNTPASFSSLGRVDDGEWHHVVVQGVTGFADDPATTGVENALEFWIDGKLNRRVIYGEGGRPLNFNTYATPENWFSGFTGDIMEVVWRNDELEKTNIERLYYTAFGYNPIFADIATGSAQMLEAKVKGNRGRMLVLHFGRAEGNSMYDIPTEPTQLASSNTLAGYTVNQDGYLVYSNVAGMIVSHQHVAYAAHPSDMVQGYTPAYQKEGFFVDDVTGMGRFINLQTDLDLSEFDVIAVKNYPKDDASRRAVVQGFTASAPTPQQVRQRFEEFCSSVRQAVVDGHSLVVTDPRFAVDLGLVDRVEEISRLRDPALDDGLFNMFEEHAFLQQDPRSYMIDPFGGWAQSDRMPTAEEQAADSEYLHGRKPQLYYDTHDNNRSRIVATVEGLTDLPAWVVTDYINDVYPDPLKYSEWLRTGNTFRYANREDGLQIGDEFVEETHIFSKPENSPVNTDVVIPAAVPPGHLLVGTAVVRYGAQQWKQLTLEDNPYADYIKAAVVQPGDRWAGQTVKGRLYMSLGQNNEVESTVLTLWEDDLDNPSTTRPVGDIGGDPIYGKETDYSKTWQKSAARTLVGSVQYTGGSTDQSGPGGVNGPSGHWVQVVSSDGSTAVQWESGETSQLPITPDYMPAYEQIPHVNMPMLVRGLAWLRGRDVADDGAVKVVPAAASGGGELVDPSVVADRSTHIAVEPMQAAGSMTPPLEAADRAVVVHAWAASATGVMTPLEKRVKADPMTVNGTMGQGTRFVFDATNAIPLYIQGPEVITLYLEDI